MQLDGPDAQVDWPDVGAKSGRSLNRPAPAFMSVLRDAAMKTLGGSSWTVCPVIFACMAAGACRRRRLRTERSYCGTPLARSETGHGPIAHLSGWLFGVVRNNSGIFCPILPAAASGPRCGALGILLAIPAADGESDQGARIPAGSCIDFALRLWKVPPDRPTRGQAEANAGERTLRWQENARTGFA